VDRKDLALFLCAPRLSVISTQGSSVTLRTVIESPKQVLCNRGKQPPPHDVMNLFLILHMSCRGPDTEDVTFVVSSASASTGELPSFRLLGSARYGYDGAADADCSTPGLGLDWGTLPLTSREGVTVERSRPRTSPRTFISGQEFSIWMWLYDSVPQEK
jgi:hypothetical protein